MSLSRVAMRLLVAMLLTLLALPTLNCLDATALNVIVYSDVPCSANARAALVGGTSPSELMGRPAATTSTVCVDGTPLNALGSVIMTPLAEEDGSVAFAMMQRPDGAPADGCLDPAEAAGCIVAKRQLRYIPQTTLDVRVDLRLSCLGVVCPQDQTCVQGTCRSSVVDPGECPGGVCGEGTLKDVSLATLSLSASALSPSFAPITYAYTASMSTTVSTMPATTTVTATTQDLTARLAIQGVPATSGVASSPITINTGPNPIDVTVTSADGTTQAHYTVVVTGIAAIAYIKASNPRNYSAFGANLAVSGETLVVGCPREPSNATGVNGPQTDTSMPGAGAAYVFTRTAGVWSQQAYLKASNPQINAIFGYAVAISGDTIVVGAHGESSNATGVNGNQSDSSAVAAGAAYVFTRASGVWTQQAYLKASNTRLQAGFGDGVSIDGDTVVVGAAGESSNATGVDGTQSDTSASGAGAAYVFTRSAGVWTQQAYLKASNTRAAARFGYASAIAGDTVVVSAYVETSKATGIDGNQADTSVMGAGAAYVFTRSAGVWTQQAYIKASNTAANAAFGYGLAIEGDTLVVGASRESSNATGVGGDQTNSLAMGAGAAYVYARAAGVWTQQAYLKASNTRANASFGTNLALAGDRLVIGSTRESSNAKGINGNQSNTSILGSGAAYSFARVAGVWAQSAYLKASNNSGVYDFGVGTGVTGALVAVGAIDDPSGAKGIDGDQTDTSSPGSGAVYVY